MCRPGTNAHNRAGCDHPDDLSASQQGDQDSDKYDLCARDAETKDESRHQHVNEIMFVSYTIENVVHFEQVFSL
jgi:hypothetical protein